MQVSDANPPLTSVPSTRLDLSRTRDTQTVVTCVLPRSSTSAAGASQNLVSSPPTGPALIGPETAPPLRLAIAACRPPLRRPKLPIDVDSLCESRRSQLAASSTSTETGHVSSPLSLLPTYRTYSHKKHQTLFLPPPSVSPLATRPSAAPPHRPRMT